MFERLSQLTATLLGRSAYQPPTTAPGDLDLDSPSVVRMRTQMGGQLQPPTTPQTRWYLEQLEAAERDADAGNLELAGKLMRSARTDGVFAGVLSTRTGGLVRLPKHFRGDADVVATLEVGPGGGDVRSAFDDMLPPSELAQLAADGVLLGVGVGELVPVAGRAYPVFVRLEPQWLVYHWHLNRWYYRSVAGLLPITPGDGRWVLHTPGGRSAPWVNGIWRAVGRAYIRKDHAANLKDNWEAKLANPARVAVSPQGAGEMQKQSWFQTVMAWGINSVFGVTPGYDVKLIESNGRGWESFNQTIADQNNEMIIAVAGQVVTVTGGVGFANADVHKSIRADLIKGTADDLAYTVNTQVLPVFVATVWGEDAVDTKLCTVEWDATPPKDRNAEATSLVTAATAVQSLTAALAPYGLEPNVDSLCSSFGIPVEVVEQPDDVPAAVADRELFNGAQVSSLLEVVGQVVAGQLPRESAVAILVTAFGMSPEQADTVLGTVGAGFVPASASVDVKPLAPAPAAPKLVPALPANTEAA